MRADRGTVLVVAAPLCALAICSSAVQGSDIRALNLSEAVRLTLELDPEIRSARHRIALAEGQLQQAQGMFDQTVRVSPAYTYDQHQNFPFLVDREVRTRSVLSGLAEGFRQASDDFLNSLASLDLTSVECPEELVPPPVGLLDTRADVRGTGLSADDVAFDFAGLDLDAASFDICIPSGDPRLRPEIALNSIQEIQDALGLALNDLVIIQEQIVRERLAFGQNVADAIATKADLAVERLADVPRDEESKTPSFEVSYLKPFRTGVSLGAAFRLQSSQRNFKFKSLDPSFGGMGVPNQFPSRLSASLILPLRKGKGRVSAMAPERAAEHGLDAQQFLLRHTMSSEVFGTIVAYLDLVAAQDRLELLQESAARQRQIVSITQDLVTRGDLAGVESDRAEASAFLVDAGVSESRLAVLRARLVLANAIGLPVEDLDSVPSASDALPQRLEDVRVQRGAASGWIDRALASRWDRKAIGRIRDAAQVLRDAAKADRRQQLDFFATGGLSTLYESPFFKFLPEEVDPEDQPEDSPVHYDRPDGVWRSLNESWEPFVTAGLSMRIAFKNNVARGRLEQQQAGLRRAEIEFGEIDRSIRNRIVSLWDALDRSRIVVERTREVVGYQTRTLEAAQTRYARGQIALIDLLTTENDWIREQLDLVQAVQVHQSLLARLRFEAGSLLQFDDPARNEDPTFVNPGQFVAPRAG